MSRSSGPDGARSARRRADGPPTRDDGRHPANPSGRSSRGSRSPGRGQVEPLAALAAVLAVGIALSAYALTLAGAVPAGGERDRADPTLRRVTDELGVGGVVDPADLDAALSAAPSGYEVRITLTAGERTWTAGPPAPPGADAAARPVSVRRPNGEVRPGRLRVEVWT